MYCVTGVTGKTGTTFYTQNTRINLPKEFRNAVDEAQSESKMKQTSATLRHLKYFMDTISNQLSKWEDM